MMENIKQILNETGRTISNKDRGLASMMMDKNPEQTSKDLKTEPQRVKCFLLKQKLKT